LMTKFKWDPLDQGLNLGWGDFDFAVQILGER